VSGLGRIETQLCTCGKPLFQCATWGDPIHRAFRSESQFLEYAARASNLARIQNLICLPRILSAPRTMELLGQEVAFFKELCRDYNGVIDSSKELTRGILLAFGPTKATWVHIVRHPGEVIQSGRDRVRRGVPIKIYRRRYNVPSFLLPVLDVALGLLWLVWTLITFLIGRSLLRKRYICVSYEEFTRDPQGVSTRVAERVGIPVSGPAIQDRISGDIPVGHILGGNRMSTATTFRIARHEGKPTSLVTRVMTFWLLPLYWLLTKCR